MKNTKQDELMYESVEHQSSFHLWQVFHEEITELFLLFSSIQLLFGVQTEREERKDDQTSEKMRQRGRFTKACTANQRTSAVFVDICVVCQQWAYAIISC